MVFRYSKRARTFFTKYVPSQYGMVLWQPSKREPVHVPSRSFGGHVTAVPDPNVWCCILLFLCTLVRTEVKGQAFYGCSVDAGVAGVGLSVTQHVFLAWTLFVYCYFYQRSVCSNQRLESCKLPSTALMHWTKATRKRSRKTPEEIKWRPEPEEIKWEKNSFLSTNVKASRNSEKKIQNEENWQDKPNENLMTIQSPYKGTFRRTGHNS